MGTLSPREEKRSPVPDSSHSPHSSDMIEPWEKLASEPRGDYRVFTVRQDESRSPRTGQAHAFYVIESSNWVNVIPVTPEGKLVFVKQYRHGTAEITLEVPGGLVDPEDGSPDVAARREMQEETGYDTDEIVYLGEVAPNPAIQNNVCYTYLALNARLRGPQRPEGTEEIDVVLVDPADVPGLVTSGRITHALIVVAFYLYDQYQRAQEGGRIQRPDVSVARARAPS